MTDWDGARAKADEVSRRFKTDVPPVDVFAIADSEGIEIRYFDPDKDPANLNDISGLLDKTGSTYTIYLNKNEGPERQAFTLGHELGHYFLGHKQSEYGVYLRNSLYSDDKPEAEKEADLFAAELLMPLGLLRKFMKNSGLTKSNVVQLASAFGVSSRAMELRLKNL